MRILVVEDDPETATFLKSALERESFAVDAVHDGEKGSYLARTNDYDLIVLDNILPGKSGPEVCRDIRECGKRTPIIVLSVESETSRKVTLLQSGADDYLAKPYSFEELLARIHAILRRPRTMTEPAVHIGPITLDSARQQVWRNKTEVYLTRKEFSLLEYLMRNSGKVVSRSMIMEHVWDIESDPFSNTVEVHISNLRKKLYHGDKDSIRNVPGRGYKIVG